tara:strand:- start:4146 stop:4886 length:741 start_codon:yes stop_codon:yes gene_type:complete
MTHNISTERVNQLKVLLMEVKINSEDLLVNKTKIDLQVFNEALTHTSAQVEYNHEKLEFLGDAVLRLAASEFIDSQFPNMQVGERSALRAQLVSDNWLTEVGKSIKIEQFLIIGSKASKDESALSTLQAEATEALIGAIYECFKDINKVKNWLYPYWLETSIKVLEDPYRKNSKSALQEWSQSNGLKLPRYEVEELSQQHGDPKRFFCKVHLGNQVMGKGWGGSRKIAEKEAAKFALKNIKLMNSN